MGVGREAAGDKRGSRGAASSEKLPRTHAAIRSYARHRCLVFASRGQYSGSRSKNRGREETLARNREKGKAPDGHAASSSDYLCSQRQPPNRRPAAACLPSARLHKKEKARRRHVSPLSPHAPRRSQSFAAAIPGRGHRSKGGGGRQRWHSLRRDVAAGE